MSPDDLQTGLVGAGGAGVLYGIAYLYGKVFGSGKERIDDAQVTARALEANYQASLAALRDQIGSLNTQIVGLNEQLKGAWGENATLRQTWVGDFTAHEVTRDRIEDDKNAALIKAAVAEAEVRSLLQQKVVLERENARLLGMVATPNVYPPGLLDLPASAASPEKSS